MNPNNPEEYKKRTRGSFLITVIGLTIIIVSYVLFVQNQEEMVVEMDLVTKQKEEIQQHEAKVIDTLNQVREILKEVTDSIQKKALPPKILSEDDAIIVVLRYYFNRKERDVESVLSLMSSKIERFYGARNVDHEFIRKDLNQYWENNFESKYDMDYLEIDLTVLDKTHYQAQISGVHYIKKSKNDSTLIEQGILSTFKIDANKKIYYVREKVTD